MIFNGFEPWRQNFPEIEIRAGDRLLDLHNWGSFRGLEYLYPESLTLIFDYDESEGDVQSGGAAVVRLLFDGVSELRVGHAKFEHAYGGETLSEFMYRELHPGRGLIEVVFMDGFTIRFEAGSVTLV